MEIPTSDITMLDVNHMVCTLKKGEKLVFTSSKNYKGGDNVIVHSLDELSEEIQDWVRERTEDGTQTEHESIFAEKLNTFDIPFETQVFFNINLKSYFLDFYLPKANVAVEIDGSFHKGRKTYDKARDKRFKSIGILTVRIPNNVVNSDQVVNHVCEGILKRYYGGKIKCNDENKVKVLTALQGKDDFLKVPTTVPVE